MVLTSNVSNSVIYSNPGQELYIIYTLLQVIVQAYPQALVNIVCCILMEQSLINKPEHVWFRSSPLLTLIQCVREEVAGAAALVCCI